MYIFQQITSSKPIIQAAAASPTTETEIIVQSKNWTSSGAEQSTLINLTRDPRPARCAHGDNDTRHARARVREVGGTVRFISYLFELLALADFRLR